MQWSIERKLASGFGLALALALLLGFVAYNSVRRSLEAGGWITHTQEVRVSLADVLTAVQSAETGQRDYILTGSENSLVPYREALRQIPEKVETLRRLTEDNPKQQSRLPVLEERIRTRLALLNETKTLRQEKGFEAARRAILIGRGRRAMDAVRAAIGEMEQAESGLLTQRTATLQRESQVTILVFGFLTLFILLGGGLLYGRLRSDVGARRRAEEALEQANSTLETRVQERTMKLEQTTEALRHAHDDLEERVQRRTADLAALNKEMEAFSYSVSHDLRAPLRSLDGFSLALQEDYADVLDDAGKEFLERIRAGSQRMAQLIDDLLALSRIGRTEMTREEVDLTAIAHSVAHDLQRAEPDRQVELRIAPGLTTVGDGALLRIVLVNLLGNAWKFTSQRPQAHIEFGSTVQEGKTAYFVRDDGAGFDMRYVDKLFGAFQRLHGMNEFSGTGIGLATVQRIIHRHGGRVSAAAAVGQGATFTFTLAEEKPDV